MRQVTIRRQLPLLTANRRNAPGVVAIEKGETGVDDVAAINTQLLKTETRKDSGYTTRHELHTVATTMLALVAAPSTRRSSSLDCHSPAD